jgi:hypothetical protein
MQCERCKELEIEVERLRAALLEATMDIEDWASYADEHFRKKWRLDATLEKHRRTAAGEKDGRANNG